MPAVWNGAVRMVNLAEGGYWIGDVSDLPGQLWPIAENARWLATSRLADRAWVRSAKASPKSFYVNALDALDPLVGELVEYAHRFTPYPDAELSHVGVFLSGLRRQWPWTRYQGTQRPHFDVGDPKHVKLFVLLSHVGRRDGPLKFWPADASMYFDRGRSRVDEAEVLSKIGEPIALTGPPFTAALIDVSRCIHYGSRGGSRQTLVLHWCSDAKRYAPGVSAPFADLNVAAWPR